MMYVVKLSEGVYLNASSSNKKIRVPRAEAHEYKTKSRARKATKKFRGSKIEEIT